MAAPDITTLSTEPTANTSLGSINVAEGCPAANVNDALRWLAAAIAVLRANLPTTGGLVSASGGQFTTNPTLSGQGGYLHNSASTASGGAVTFLPSGSALPSGSDGDLVLFYQ